MWHACNEKLCTFANVNRECAFKLEIILLRNNNNFGSIFEGQHNLTICAVALDSPGVTVPLL